MTQEISNQTLAQSDKQDSNLLFDQFSLSHIVGQGCHSFHPLAKRATPLSLNPVATSLVPLRIIRLLLSLLCLQSLRQILLPLDSLLEPLITQKHLCSNNCSLCNSQVLYTCRRVIRDSVINSPVRKIFCFLPNKLYELFRKPFFA